MLEFLSKTFGNDPWWVALLAYTESLASIWKIVFGGSIILFLGLLIVLITFLFPESRRSIVKAKQRLALLGVLIVVFALSFFTFAQERREKIVAQKALENAELTADTNKSQLAEAQEQLKTLTVQLALQTGNGPQVQSQIAEIQSTLQKMQSNAPPSEFRKLSDADRKKMIEALKPLSVNYPQIKIAISSKDIETLEYATSLKFALRDSGFKVDDIFDPVLVRGRDFLGLRMLVKDRTAKLTPRSEAFREGISRWLGEVGLTDYERVPPASEFMLLVGPRN